MKYTISLAFKLYSEDRLLSFATIINERMTATAQYVALKTSYEAMRASLTAFSTAKANALNGGKDRIRDKNDAKMTLIEQLAALGRKVEDAAGENPNFITDAGYEIRATTRTPAAKEMVTELQTPKLKCSNENRKNYAQLEWPEMANVLVFGIRFKKKTETVWNMDNFNDDFSFVFNNLESDMAYDFSIRAIGSGNVKSDWSPIGSIWIN